MSQRKRIVWMVNAGFTEADLDAQLSGAGKGWLVTLAAHLSQSHELHVISVDPYGTPIKGKKITNHYLKPKNWRLKMIAKSLWPLENLEGDLLPQMKLLIDQIQPDLVHIHGTEKQFIRIQPHLSERKIPLLVSLQGLMGPIAQKFTAAYSKNFIESFNEQRGGTKTYILPRSLRTAYNRILRQSKIEHSYAPKIQHFAGRTEWDKQIAQLWNPASHYHHVDRILKPAFYQAEWSSPTVNEPFVVHTTTGNATYKGLETIAEACWLLQQMGVEIEWRIAGLEVTDWSVRAAKTLLHKKFPNSGLVFLGRCSAAQIIDSMQSAHAYAMASHIENSPNNLAEAMLVGMPCVASLAGGTATYVAHNKNGILVQPGEPYGLAAALNHLRLNPEKAAVLGAEARKTALDRHNPEKIKQQITVAYAQILN